MTTQEIQKEVERLACKLHKERGIPMKQACALACRAVLRTLGRPPGSGLGQNEGAFANIKAAGEAAPVKAVREAVSPWLWILSLASGLKAFFGKK
ncbi:MAG: hypothetical protein ACREDF_11070 [Thermoplasmata archaeon]